MPTSEKSQIPWTTCVLNLKLELTFNFWEELVGKGLNTRSEAEVDFSVVSLKKNEIVIF